MRYNLTVPKIELVSSRIDGWTSNDIHAFLHTLSKDDYKKFRSEHRDAFRHVAGNLRVCHELPLPKVVPIKDSFFVGDDGKMTGFLEFSLEREFTTRIRVEFRFAGYDFSYVYDLHCLYVDDEATAEQL